MGILGQIKEKIQKGTTRLKNRNKGPVQKAIGWVYTNRIPNAGLPPYHRAKFHTPEVTGYLIPTLYRFGEKELARELVQWEASVQRPDGAFNAPNTDTPYTFDTAQVARGFLAMLDDMPQLEKNLRRACDYVERQIDATGKVNTPSYKLWKLSDGTMLSEYGNLYVLPPLLEVGKKLSEPRYTEAAKRGMNYFRRKPDLVEFKPELATLSHYFGYMMEALVDLGEIDLAKKGLERAATIQREDGSIPAYPGVHWICSTGMAQLAIAWYKLGIREPADKAVNCLERIQNPSGGFYGGYGKGAEYFPEREITWAVKFFLDAKYWQTRRVEEHHA